jgi:hypothetical protein
MVAHVLGVRVAELMDDADLRAALSAIEPRGRELLRRYLIADQPDRDALALRLLPARS